MNLEEHLKRQIAFSRATFGPGDRMEGVIDHIKKELDEIVESDNGPDEWVDVVILALDGLWRSIREEDDNFVYSSNSISEKNKIWYGCESISNDQIAHLMVSKILEKQNKNELRDWPDWRTADPNKAIEHDRTGEENA